MSNCSTLGSGSVAGTEHWASSFMERSALPQKTSVVHWHIYHRLADGPEFEPFRRDTFSDGNPKESNRSWASS